MKKYEYAQESIDLKLVALLLVKRVWLIVGACLLGGSLFALGLWGLKVVGPFQEYQVESMYYVDFLDNENQLYYNSYTWGSWLHTDELIRKIEENLDFAYEPSQLRESIHAYVLSDVRMPSTFITSTKEKEALAIARATEEAVLDMVNELREVENIRLITAPSEVISIVDGQMWLRVILLGISLFGGWSFVGVLLFILWDSRIYIPNTLLKRYEIPVITLSLSSIERQLESLFPQDQEIAITTVLESTSLLPIIDALKEKDENNEYVKIKNLVKYPEGMKELKSSSYGLLVVEAKKAKRQQIEYILDLATMEGIEFQGLLLWGEDQSLIKQYYFGKREGR